MFIESFRDELERICAVAGRLCAELLFLINKLSNKSVECNLVEIFDVTLEVPIEKIEFNLDKKNNNGSYSILTNSFNSIYL